jgi:class 3 adenylate cyclase
MRYGPPFATARRRDGRRLAYQVVGEGDLDLVFLFGWPTHLGLMWEDPSFAGFLGKLSSFSRLILFDRLGDGLSDRGPTGHTFDDEMDDVRCVLEAAGSERAAFIGSHTPVDIRGLLGSIQAPVLVLHRTGDRLADVHASRYMAERIPGARLVELPGDDHLPFFGDQDAVVALTQEFLTGASPAADPDRVLATVLFTDLVDSTRLAAGMGDRRWHRTLEQHNQVVRSNLARFRGREVKTTGDGFLATFDGPARAIRSADAIRTGVRDQGLEVRAGLHTGECELLGDDIGGIAVHIAARVLAKAAAGEILCSRTVKDLVAGSGFAFAERGTYRLRGVPDSWQLYVVEPAR